MSSEVSPEIFPHCVWAALRLLQAGTTAGVLLWAAALAVGAGSLYQPPARPPAWVQTARSQPQPVFVLHIVNRATLEAMWEEGVTISPATTLLSETPEDEERVNQLLAHAAMELAAAGVSLEVIDLRTR